MCYNDNIQGGKNVNTIQMNSFENDFDNKKKISIGQTFMISSKGILKWAKIEHTYGEACIFNTYEYNYIKQKDEDDILFVVKYIGNGYVQEMLTGETMLLARIDERLLEDDSDELKTADSECICTPTKYEDLENYGFDSLSMPEYIAQLEEYKLLTTKSPLICSVVEGELMFKIDEESKTEYLKHSNEERISLMNKYKEEALRSLEETIKDLDSTIQTYSRITSKTLDMAYLENEIYDFEKKVKQDSNLRVI